MIMEEGRCSRSCMRKWHQHISFDNMKHHIKEQDINGLAG
jgi:hypothetical protein